MQRIALTLLSCSFVFTFGSLQAQEVNSQALPKAVEQVVGAADAVTDGAIKEPGDITKLEEEIAQKVMSEHNTDTELAVDQDDTTVGELEDGPVVVSVSPQGELIGQTNAIVSGDLVPIEANVTLVSGGVLLGKTMTNDDGSFSFSNVTPGDYNIYGCASSFCGQQACTVVSNGDFDVVEVQLDQQSTCRCNGNFANAPAASFTSNAGGFSSGTAFSSGPSFGGGGFSGSSFGGGGFGGGGFGGGGSAAGGGRLLGTRAFRLLAVGGIATAIAVGASDDDDDVSPTE